MGENWGKQSEGNVKRRIKCCKHIEQVLEGEIMESICKKRINPAGYWGEK